MRDEILKAAERWRDDWLTHADWEQMTVFLATLGRYVDSGELGQDRVMPIMLAAAGYATSGDQTRLDQVLDDLP